MIYTTYALHIDIYIHVLCATCCYVLNRDCLGQVFELINSLLIVESLAMLRDGLGSEIVLKSIKCRECSAAQ